MRWPSWIYIREEEQLDACSDGVKVQKYEKALMCRQKKNLRRSNETEYLRSQQDTKK
jgi:hypothetical protein